MNADEKEVLESGDAKAKGAWMTADAIVQNSKENIPILMIISYEVGGGGVSFTEVAQFLYDNYTEPQIAGLFLAITSPDSISSREERYSSIEELEQIRGDAKKNLDESEKKFLEGLDDEL